MTRLPKPDNSRFMNKSEWDKRGGIPHDTKLGTNTITASKRGLILLRGGPRDGQFHRLRRTTAKSVMLMGAGTYTRTELCTDDGLPIFEYEEEINRTNWIELCCDADGRWNIHTY